MPQPLRSIIPVWNVQSIAEAAAMGFIGMPGNPAKPKQLWRDNAAVYSQEWWSTTKTYQMLARNGDGSLKTTVFGTAEFYSTYTSLDVVSTYRDYRFMFGPGKPFQIPYLVDVTVDKADAAEPNFVGTEPARDYPLMPGANHMLVFDGKEVMVWDVAEFSKKHTPPAEFTPADRVAAIRSVVNAPGDPVEQLLKVYHTLKGFSAQNVIIT